MEPFMALPNLKRLFASNNLKVGHSIFEFNSPGLGQIISASGVDYVFLDMEHSGFGISETKRAIAGLRLANIPALVRPPSDAYHHIARALDVGAAGLIMPMVSSKEEAEHIVSCMKYPPMGQRGVALNIAHDEYKPGDTVKKLATANQRTVFVALIETKEGIDNIDAIASVKGLDCLWIGHFALSCSLGINGQFDHPDFIKAADKVKRAAKKHNKALGRLTGDAAGAIALYKQGYDVLCYSGDLWVYQEALVKGIDEIRAGCKPRKSIAAKSSKPSKTTKGAKKK
jgi:2-dehydro-3-deoxyglucarate aldolase/4-hydroxy-2-oxoheptanedioate aldolase